MAIHISCLDYEQAINKVYLSSVFNNRPSKTVYTKSKEGVVIGMLKSLFEANLIPKDMKLYNKLNIIFTDLYSLMYDSDEKDSFFKHFNMQISMQGLEIKSLHITANIDWQDKIFISFDELKSLIKFL